MSGFSVNLQGQVAIVTGAGADIGRSIALALAAAGAAVMVNDLNPDRAENVTEEIKAAGGRAFAFQGDVTNRFQMAALVEETRNQFEKLTLLVNAAGGFKPDSVLKIDEWDWRKQLDIMLTGALFCTQFAGRVMSDEGGGVIVNLASNLWDRTNDGGVAYVAAKAGLIGLTRQTARELGPSGIRVNAVCPGNIEHFTSPPVQVNMLGRAGSFEEVASVVSFLCSDAARFITGEAITVDGGSF